MGEGIIVLVMNCHGAFYPYGPYQLNGIEYKGYEGTDDVDYVVKVNKEARQGMVDKLLEDFNSSTTPFVCLSCSLRCSVAYYSFSVGRRYKR